MQHSLANVLPNANQGGGSGVSGSGTDNTVPLWNGTDALDDSYITQTASTVAVDSAARLGTKAVYSVADGVNYRIDFGSTTFNFLLNALNNFSDSILWRQGFG